MKIRTFRHPLSKIIIGGGMSLLSMMSYGNNIGNVTVKVTIISPPPCTINNNQPIEVDFGEVMTTRVDGINYRKQIEYNLDCPSGQLLRNSLKLQIKGTNVNLARPTRALLVPNINNFGIELQHDNAAFAPNTWINFTYPDFPKLYAVPVMRIGSTLTTGAFSASSTMMVEYQ